MKVQALAMEQGGGDLVQQLIAGPIAADTAQISAEAVALLSAEMAANMEALSSGQVS